MSEGADCVAVESYLLDKGAERVVFRCGEGRVVGGWRQGEMRVRFLGKILVAKESIHQEELLDMGFHSKMCKLHAKSQQVCDLFNKRIAFLGPSHLMNYVQVGHHSLSLFSLILILFISLLASPSFMRSQTLCIQQGRRGFWLKKGWKGSLRSGITTQGGCGRREQTR